MGNMERIDLPNKGASLFCDAVICGDLMIISGMLPMDAQGKLVGKDDPAAQAEQVFKNIQAVLDTRGLHFSDIVKITIFLKNIDDRPHIAPVRQKFFGDQKPASTLLEISRLAHPDALMEIEATAYLGNR